MTLTHTATSIDVRDIAPPDRHPLIRSTYEKLAVGAALELVNDHDPRALFHQFQAQMPGKFSWDYMQAGPDLWRVHIVKLAPVPGDAACCGSCGGA